MEERKDIMASLQILFARNAEAPFCYPPGGTRRWPPIGRGLERGDAVELVAKRDGAAVARSVSAELEIGPLRIALTRDCALEVTSRSATADAPFDLEISVQRGAETETQTISVRPAPPRRPIAYYADFADDLINIFGAGVNGDRPFLHHQLRDPGNADAAAVPYRGAESGIVYDRQGFDQYFRRMQCHGIDRLILWLLPFPVVADPSAYEPEDWDRWQKAARAILDSPELDDAIRAKPGFNGWKHRRDVFRFRLDRKAHADLAESAAAHEISLAMSYRPFEHAVSKYLEVPAFDVDGTYLWGFLPGASPAMNFRGADLGFVHYRGLLADMSHAEAAEPRSIRIPRARGAREFLRRFVAKGDNLRILLSDYPPLQTDSFVLARQSGGDFRLQRFHDIQRAADARRLRVAGFTVSHDEGQGVLITGLKIPARFRYIILENPSGEAPLEMPGRDPVILQSTAGNRIGRTNIYWSFDESSPERKKSRVAGIDAEAEFCAVFDASLAGNAVAGERQKLDRCTLVIDRGEPFSREMADYELAAMRAVAVREIRTVLRHPAYREIYVNTRSHTQLAGDMGDGADGVRPIADYRSGGKRYRHLGIDLGYAPRGAAADPTLDALASESSDVERITMWHPEEWTGACQSPDCSFPWRYARNTHVAAGIRMLLQELSVEFPSVRIRAVLPERAAATDAIAEIVSKLPADAVSYAASRNNWIPNICEGMAMVDLADLAVEPALLGTGPYVDPRVLEAYLNAVIADMADDHGSTFRGPHAVMYEGQWTFDKNDAGRAVREDRIRRMLSRPAEIDEVVVYEAADWLYRMPGGGWDFLNPRS